MADGSTVQEGGWGEIEEEITCVICEEIFTQPKTIPCLHTFCEQCIKSTIEASKLTGNELCCPICRAEMPQDVTSIPTNFSTKRLIEIFRKRHTVTAKQELKCGECDDEDATVTMWCVDCDSTLCGECYKQHNRMKKFKSHETVTMENFMQSPKTVLYVSTHAALPTEFCNDHVTQPLDLYCMTCSCLICRDCTYVDHREHQYNFVYKLADVERDKIKVVATPLKKMLEQVRAGLEKVEERDNEIDGRCEAEVIQPIRDIYQRLHEILQEQEASDLQKVNTIKNTLHSYLGSQIKELKLLEEWLVSCDEFVTKATTSQRPNELLTYSKYITNRVAELTGQVERTNLDPVCGIDDLILSTSSPDDYASQLTPVCSVSTLPHVANCSVKGPAAMSKYGPVKLTVTLKDKDGLLVPNQSEHLRVEFKADNFAGSGKVMEASSGIYTLLYRPKKRDTHSVSVSWKNTKLKNISISPNLRDYSTLQQDVRIINKYGPYDKNLTHPYMFAVGLNNELIVRDYLAKRLIVFDEQLQYSHSIGEGMLECPTGLAVSKKGHLYVADYKFHCVNKMIMNGKLISRIGTCGTGDGQFQHPRSLLLSQSQLLFVCDSCNHRIQVFQNDSYFYSFGEQGEDPGSFIFPFGLALSNNEDRLFVTDHGNHRVQMFTPSGQFIALFGDFTNSPYKLSRPTGICCTLDGHVLISSMSTHCVLIFDEDGNYVSVIQGAYGNKKRFSKPIGVVMRSNGQVVIASDGSCNLALF